MKNIILAILFLGCLSIPARAADFSPPTVPETAADAMPRSENFADGLWELAQKALSGAAPDFREALKVSASALAAVLLVSTFGAVSADTAKVCQLVGVLSVSGLLLMKADAMIRLGASTVTEISEYGKLLLPVMTAALAAQGGLTSSAALYTGTAVFNSVLSSLISRGLVSMVYLFLGAAVAAGALEESVLKALRDLIKSAVSWCLKTLLTVFTTYMSITGVITGTTDAAALKATKVTISSVVPVVGGILSDASEAVLVSAGLAKNAAGIYGIFAVLALFLTPFLRIGCHYLVLKATHALAGIFGAKAVSDLIGDFAAAMGLLLAMTGAACLLQLISTVCFLKGVT